MTSKYRAKPKEVMAVQWFPDPKFGEFKEEKYTNKKIGVDRYGVEYTVMDCGIQTPKGFLKIIPGDWIVYKTQGCCFICPDNVFNDDFEKVN